MRVLALLLVALALAGCHPAQPTPARPAMWKVADGDSTIWLIGSIHMLPPDTRWQTGKVRSAIDAADLLVLEIPPGDAGAQAATFRRMAQARDLPPLAARLAPAQRALLAEATRSAGVDGATLDGLKSWAAALMLATGAGRERGATREAGVEAVLTRAFRNKRITAFETLEEQLALFDALDEASQRHLLARAVVEAASPGGGYDATLAAWRTGDTAAMAASFNPLFTGEPALEKALLSGRNARWARWIEQRMERRGRVLIAVGAGHLVGPKSVVAMLRAHGLRVARVQ